MKFWLSLSVAFLLCVSSLASAQDNSSEIETPEVLNPVESLDPDPGALVPSATPAASPSTLAAPVEPQEEEEEDKSWLKKFNGIIFGTLFFDVAWGNIQVDEVDRDGSAVIDEATGRQKKKTVGLPFLIVFLMLGGLFFTFWFRWINVRAFKHAIDVIRGRFDRPEDQGEISHFRALTSALSATVGLGNIAGVAVAIQLGGPGAVVWMSLIAVFAMCAKFSSCTLAQMYRKVHSDGSISGGPMYYLDIGWRQFGPVAGYLGKMLAIVYAIFVMGGAIGGGNMFQANQTAAAIITTFGLENGSRWPIGIVLAVSVGLVILGGIKRIGAATSRIVPAMCGIYVVASLFIILSNFSEIPGTFALMFHMAFANNAFFGGFFGVLVVGVQRAVFSNEGGLGSAAIAHAAAKTDEPVREGLVAMVGPVIDTIIVCNMTALVVIITGVWNNPEVAAQAAELGSLKGVALTSAAFATSIPWFPYVLTVCVTLFAYSTMISWCYYGERGWIYLLDHFGEGVGHKSVVIFRIVFVLFIVVGAVQTLSDVLDFSDAMILSMAFPNIIGSVFLAPKVLEKLRDYWGRYTSGQMSPTD